MSFEFEIDPKEAASAEFMTRVHRILLREMMKAAKVHRISRADVARILEVDKSVVSRALNGKSNLTIRTISDLLWAIGSEPEFDACPIADEIGCNVPTERKITTTETTFTKVSKTTTKTVSWAGSVKKELSKSKPRGSNKLQSYSYAH